MASVEQYITGVSLTTSLTRVYSFFPRLIVQVASHNDVHGWMDG